MLNHRGAIFLPPVASVDGRLGSVGIGKAVALAVQDDHMVDDVSAVDASKSRDSVPSFVDDLGHSQAGTAGTLHDILPGYTIASTGDLC